MAALCLVALLQNWTLLEPFFSSLRPLLWLGGGPMLGRFFIIFDDSLPLGPLPTQNSNEPLDTQNNENRKSYDKTRAHKAATATEPKTRSN